MPRRLERHARGKGVWDSAPSRSAELQQAARADPDPAKRSPARKDTRSWCKGKAGREHVLHLVLVPDRLSWRAGKAQVCEWASAWGIDGQEYRLGWACRHREECAACGRIFREHYDLKGEECPAYPGDPGQRAEAQAEVGRDQEQCASWPAAAPRWRRPVITGPQGYRRRREGK